MSDNELLLALSDMMDKKLRNYLTSATRYEKSYTGYEAMKSDIELLKK